MAMESISSAIVIHRPVSEVFAYVENVDTIPTYMKSVRKVEHLSGSPGQIGHTIKVVSSLLGKQIENVSSLTEFEENHHTVFRGEAPFPLEISHQYEELQDGSTRLTRTTSADLTQSNLFFRLAGPRVVKSTVHDTESGLAALKKLLEDGA